MKQFTILFFAIIFLFTGCSKEKVTGSGSTVTEERPGENFTGVSMSGANNVQVTKGAAFNIQVKGYRNLLPYFETNVANGVLQLGYKDANIKNDNVEVLITLPSLGMLSIAGSGNMNVNGNFNDSNSFEANISGSGNIRLEQGVTENFSSRISGSGNISAFGMVAEKATINVSGSGDTEITATSFLDVTISGSGDVYYKGNPVITTHISGSGSVIPK